MSWQNVKNAAVLALVGAVGLPLTGCTSGDTGATGNVVVTDPIVYTKRGLEAIGDPLDPVTFAAGGDLYYKDLSSPSAQAINVTGGYTKGAGDASDPEVSYDAKKVVFSMKGPEDKTWDLWEWYINKTDLPSGSECVPAPKDSCLVRVIKSVTLADQGDDIDPVYMPDNRRIVFSSTRQQTTVKTLGYQYLDEYERRVVSLLHTVDPASTANTASSTDDSFIEQISFNQSHDRDPFVTVDGEIIYSRWDHVGGRNHFPVFKASLDGTDLFILYGAFSPGNSRLYPREMPKGGAYEGKVISALMPLQGSNEGGALVMMDVKNYSENNQPSPGVVGGKGQELPQPFNNEQLFNMRSRDEDLASVPKGAVRLSTPYPMYDGTNRVLMAWSPLNVVTVKNEAGENELREQPRYGIHVFDLDAKVNRPIVSPPEDTNFVYMEPVAIKARNLANTPSCANNANKSCFKPRDTSVSSAHIGVRSVYDTDSLGAMGTGVFTGAEAANYKTKDGAADVAALKRLPRDQRIAFFARVTAAVPTPAGVGMNIGETDFEMQRILGYTMVEPDGSMRFDVPADTAFTIQVLDNKGRAFQNHTNWIQARPDETRTCPGCHSPRRGDAINSGAILSDHDPLLGTPYIDSNIVVGSTETMADTRVNDSNLLREGMGADELGLKNDIEFVDVWTPEGKKPSFKIDYAGLSAAPTGGVINYAEHIQPIWDSHCVSCHTGNANPNLVPGRLDLTSGTDPITGRSISYQQLVGERLQFTAAGVLVLETNPETGLMEPATLPPLVTRPSGTVGGTRNSFLGEVLYGEELKSSRELTDAIKTAHNGIKLNPSASELLNASELRVVTEWMDLGAQFINDPAKYDGATVGTLNQGQFETIINPILMTNCSGCHFPGNPDHPTNFVLNSNIEGNLQITVNFINVATPAQSQLLTRSTDASHQTRLPSWSATNPDFIKILEWITAAQP